MKCPRCGDVLEQEFYGPCPACQEAVCQLQPPAPHPHFVAATLPNGLPTTQYIGQRVDRKAR